ncbi:MAG: M1 family metallopeptidase [Phycisphaerae bacterium]|nr:M1 family metallopeptidase [Phycisphaerae bacterium]
MLVLSAVAMAVLIWADDPRIDPATGRERAVYPPPRHFDHLHMRLELDIPDMTKPYLTGVERLRVAAIGSPRAALALDAAGPKVASVARLRGGKEIPTPFAQDEGRLTIRLDPPVEPGVETELVIRYTLDFPRGNGKGLTWTPGRPDGSNLTAQAAQIHSQGQPQDNRRWFLCHDFPNERLTTELLVTVEDGCIVGSNGRLISTTFAGRTGPGGATRSTWHWLQDQPHANYLVSLIVGRFEIVGLPAPAGKDWPRSAAGRLVPCYLYAPHGSRVSAARAYANTPAMLDALAEFFDEPYPWDKYSQALVRNFAAGGMENTSATTMQQASAYARAGSQDKIIAHEAGHQWTGDLVTCKSWEHVWLNEGWASYAEAIWAEASAPPDRRERAYQRAIAGFLAAQRVLNRTYAPVFPAMVSNRYGDPFETFVKPNDVYGKGAIVLHMLRRRLGDEAFRRGARLYIDRHRLGEVETDQFRFCLEEASGQSLEQFFHQWCHRPGLPALDIAFTWSSQDEAGPGSLAVRIDQTQTIDADNPAYAFDLPILVRTEENAARTWTVRVDARTQSFELPLAAKPLDAVVDPELTVAAPATVDKPFAMWRRQLDDCNTAFAQIAAIEALAALHDPVAWTALEALRDDSRRDDWLREVAEAALHERDGLAAAGRGGRP